MTVQGWAQIVVFMGLLVVVGYPLELYMARVYTGERVLLSRVLGPVERLALRGFGAGERRGQDSGLGVHPHARRQRGRAGAGGAAVLAGR